MTIDLPQVLEEDVGGSMQDQYVEVRSTSIVVWDRARDNQTWVLLRSRNGDQEFHLQQMTNLGLQSAKCAIQVVFKLCH
jgi:hypothetical protein